MEIQLSENEMDFYNDGPPPEQQVEKVEKVEMKKVRERMEKVVEKETKRVMSKEDAEKHQGTILILTRYGAHPRFQKYLKDLGFSFDHLNDKPLDELEELLTRVKMACANKTPSSIVGLGVHIAATTLEGVCLKPEINEVFDPSGLAMVLANDPQMQDIIAELDLNYGAMAMVSPESRLLMTIAMTATTLAKVNKMKKAQLNNRLPPPSLLSSSAPSLPIPPPPPMEKEKKAEDKKAEKERPKRPDNVMNFD